uniref:Uncharacterized protein n=1 Tax=Meloidogyne hapla TaxID=6305 RepID=A0A1I8BG45_MELHA
MYKEYLLKGPSTHSTSLRNLHLLKLNSLSYSFIILINQLFTTILLNKNIEIISNENFQKIYSEWEQSILDEKYFGDGYGKLCRIYLFTINIIENNNKYWNEKSDLINELNEQINVENIDLNSINCDNEESAQIISIKLLSTAKIQQSHLICIDWLINNFEEARQFFCEADIKYKDNLVLLVTEEGLLSLEAYNPYVLKLGKYLFM